MIIEAIPPRIRPSITAAPRAGQLYWCRFWDAEHTEQPEFYKTRPVIILSHRNTLSGHCLVIPASSKQQYGKWSILLSLSLDGSKSWAVCDHIYTVATSRLQKHEGTIPKLSELEFARILELAHQQFAMPRKTEGSL